MSPMLSPTASPAAGDACNSGASGALSRADAVGIPPHHLSTLTHPSPEALDEAIAAALVGAKVDVVDSFRGSAQHQVGSAVSLVLRNLLEPVCPWLRKVEWRNKEPGVALRCVVFVVDLYYLCPKVFDRLPAA